MGVTKSNRLPSKCKLTQNVWKDIEIYKEIVYALIMECRDGRAEENRHPSDLTVYTYRYGRLKVRRNGRTYVVMYRMKLISQTHSLR